MSDPRGTPIIHEGDRVHVTVDLARVRLLLHLIAAGTVVQVVLLVWLLLARPKGG